MLHFNSQDLFANIIVFVFGCISWVGGASSDPNEILEEYFKKGVRIKIGKNLIISINLVM